jgi:phospholipase/carboxylesterase
MQTQSILIQQPSQASTLVLLLHGVGASASSMQPLGEKIARHCPDAYIVSVSAPIPSGFGSGYQWLSVAGVNEANRMERIAAALPAFISSLQHWQRSTALGPEKTVLIGFSQGAIMALEAAITYEKLAGRVVALSGRFAQLPSTAHAQTEFNFIHGDQDPVISAEHSVRAAQHLANIKVSSSLHLIHGLQHGIDGQVASLVETIVFAHAKRGLVGELLK